MGPMTSEAPGSLAAGSGDRIDPMRPAVPQLHERLRRLVVQGRLEPGSRVVRRDLAARYAVSRQPVSEACNRLAEEGLLDVLSQRGTFVSRIGVDAVLSARFVLEAVEADIVRLLAARPDPAVVARGERLLDAQAAALDDADVARFVALDDDFHRHLAVAAGQARVHESIRPLALQLDRLRHLATRRDAGAAALAQHRGILAALRAGEPDAAAAAMRAHRRRIIDDLRAAIEANPGHFDRQVPLS